MATGRTPLGGILPAMGLDAAAIRRAARETLGVSRLLPGQREAIAAITEGHDTLALLPTGGGKSAIYQVAGLAIDGPADKPTGYRGLKAAELTPVET